MRILFLSPGVMGKWKGTGRLASFQQADVDLLRELGHDVRILVWNRRAIPSFWKHARWADVLYVWSIGDHTVAASLSRRPLVTVIGGYEFAAIPEAAYGNLLTARGRFMSKWMFRRSGVLLYVDESLRQEAEAVFGPRSRSFVVPTGYDADFWTPGDGPKDGSILTVCHVPTADKVRLKGVDVFLDVARMNPDLEFHIAGEADTLTRLPKNVTVHGWLERPELRGLYRRAAVYCQLSLHEGLPNAVCEAMLCGCIPVGTAVNGTPRAMGPAGIVVPHDSIAISHAIKKAIAKSMDGVGRTCRERIVTNYSLTRRKEHLRSVLEGLK